jgi:hypothetical protein
LRPSHKSRRGEAAIPHYFRPPHSTLIPHSAGRVPHSAEAYRPIVARLRLLSLEPTRSQRCP